MQNIRVGKHIDKSRIVFDLQEPTQFNSYWDEIKDKDNDTNCLILSLSTSLNIKPLRINSLYDKDLPEQPKITLKPNKPTKEDNEREQEKEKNVEKRVENFLSSLHVGADIIKTDLRFKK